VMAYTAGGMLAPAAGGLMLQWAPALGFPALLLAVAALGLWQTPLPSATEIKRDDTNE